MAGRVGTKWELIEDLTPQRKEKYCEDPRCESTLSWWDSPDNGDELCLTCIERTQLEDDFQLEYSWEDACYEFTTGAVENGCLIFPRSSGYGIESLSFICDECKETGYVEDDNYTRICECEHGEFTLKFERNQKHWKKLAK